MTIEEAIRHLEQSDVSRCGRMTNLIVKQIKDDKGYIKGYKTIRELVMCKDCKHWDNVYNDYCYRLNVLGMKADDFCSLGERREEE